MCHTIDGYLAIRPLVAGRSQEAIETILGRLTTSDQEPTDGQGLWTWRGRRMPPFPGTHAEREAVSAYLASLGGTTPHLPSAAGEAQGAGEAGAGKGYFEENCAACHSAAGGAPLAGFNLTPAQVYGLLDHLPRSTP